MIKCSDCTASHSEFRRLNRYTWCHGSPRNFVYSGVNWLCEDCVAYLRGHRENGMALPLLTPEQAEMLIRQAEVPS